VPVTTVPGTALSRQVSWTAPVRAALGVVVGAAGTGYRCHRAVWPGRVDEQLAAGDGDVGGHR